MNIAIRKLALLEQQFQAKEIQAKLEGLTTSPVDPVFREKISKLMEQVRVL